MTTHCCQFCGRAYPCLSLVEREDESCDCKEQETCPGCSEHGACEVCNQKSAGSAISEFLCEGCAQKWLDNYEPPERDLSGPTRRELDAYDLMRERRRH